jgi:hypothetical protein
VHLIQERFELSAAQIGPLALRPITLGNVGFDHLNCLSGGPLLLEQFLEVLFGGEVLPAPRAAGAARR